MAAEIVVLQKLFEVVGHADEIQLDHAFYQVDARWMHVPENEALLVQVAKGFDQLPKHAESLDEVEFLLAKVLPILDVIRAYVHELKDSLMPISVKELRLGFELQQVFVFELVNLLCQLLCLGLLELVQCGYVNHGDHLIARILIACRDTHETIFVF